MTINDGDATLASDGCRLLTIDAASLMAAALRRLPGRIGHTLQVPRCHSLGPEHRLVTFTHDARRLRARQVAGPQRQLVLQRQRDEGLVVAPRPAAGAAGLLDEPPCVARLLGAAALDGGLLLEVELLHHQRRAPAALASPAQRLRAQPVVQRVVVHLAEQRHGVVVQPLRPG